MNSSPRYTLETYAPTNEGELKYGILDTQDAITIEHYHDYEINLVKERLNELNNEEFDVNLATNDNYLKMKQREDDEIKRLSDNLKKLDNKLNQLKIEYKKNKEELKLIYDKLDVINMNIIKRHENSINF
jgi:predicted ribosome quality control (RQC) complex YloA/Tae2 family protein